MMDYKELRDKITLEEIGKEDLLNMFKSASYCNNILLGFEYEDKTYMIFNYNLKEQDILITTSSRNDYIVKLSLSKKRKKEIIRAYEKTSRLTYFYSSFIEHNTREVKGNKGIKWEYFHHYINGIPYKRERVPFYMGADININGVEYSIKWQNATLCTLKGLCKALNGNVKGVK